jgi:hypothetical protein
MRCANGAIVALVEHTETGPVCKNIVACCPEGTTTVCWLPFPHPHTHTYTFEGSRANERQCIAVDNAAGTAEGSA